MTSSSSSSSSVSLSLSLSLSLFVKSVVYVRYKKEGNRREKNLKNNKTEQQTEQNFIQTRLDPPNINLACLSHDLPLGQEVSNFWYMLQTLEDGE